MRIMLTGGGTAGHAIPLILVGKSLQKNHRVELLYVGSRQGIEKKLAREANIPFKAIFSGKRRVYFSLSNVWDAFKIGFGIIQVFFLLISFKPTVIFAKGGYVTVPVIFWLKFFKTPLVIHESDAVMGRANLWALKYARKACLGFPLNQYQQPLPIDKLIYTGIPVNPEFMQTPIKTTGRPKILITGGSQGSSKINGVITEILPDLLAKFEVWHLSGERDFEELSKRRHPAYHLFSFIDKMPQILRDTDLVITRAGASTLAEIAAMGKPAIIIPLASAASDHQTANAKVFEKSNAAIVLKESKLTANSLKTIIVHLMDDEPTRQILGHHAKSLFRPDATEEIINAIFEVLKR